MSHVNRESQGQDPGLRKSKATPAGIVARINDQSEDGTNPATLYPDSPPVLGHGDLAEFPLGKIIDKKG